MLSYLCDYADVLDYLKQSLRILLVTSWGMVCHVNCVGADFKNFDDQYTEILLGTSRRCQTRLFDLCGVCQDSELWRCNVQWKLL